MFLAIRPVSSSLVRCLLVSWFRSSSVFDMLVRFRCVFCSNFSMLTRSSLDSSKYRSKISDK